MNSVKQQDYAASLLKTQINQTFIFAVFSTNCSEE